MRWGEKTAAVADDVGLGGWTVCGSVGSAADSSRDTQQCWLGTDDDKDAHELRNDVAPRVKDGARSLPIVPC
uniref:Uncharacterized protein n=1 Tax=Oryza rufipogon TaxID=4529 RepID=A0A0E0RFJ4_ORYRU